MEAATEYPMDTPQRLHRARAVVLLYHRVAQGPDPWALAVSPDHFTEHLEALAAQYRVVPLSRLAELLREDEEGPFIVLTFDDGYADNLTHAAPALVHQQMPATFFLVSAALRPDSEYWWDELTRLVLEPALLPTQLRIRVEGREHSWSLGEATEQSHEELRRHEQWYAWQDPPTPRHAMYQQLWRLCHDASPAVRERVIAQVRDWLGRVAQAPGARPILSEAEVRVLARQPGVDIGAHSATHPSLATLSEAQQWEEIAGCRHSLEKLVAGPVVNFSYPFGKPVDYTDRTVALVRDAGFRTACTNTAGAVAGTPDVWRLPRLFVTDCDRPAFERQLAEVFATVTD
jgi:peptidoglycan/xylan/chitin deacetylase (PgdA/CDA1 family)